MNARRKYSIRDILLSWAAIALGLTSLLICYFLYQALNSQFHHTWSSRIEYELGVLVPQIQHSLNSGDLRLADKNISLSATQPYIEEVSLVREGQVILSTRRALIGQPSRLPAPPSAATYPGTDAHHLTDMELAYFEGHYYASLPVRFYHGGLRTPQEATLLAHYNTEQDYRRMLADVARKLALLIGLIGLYSFGLSQLVKRQVLTPLTRLLQFTQQLKEGRYGQTIDVSSSEEFSALEQAFNSLSSHLNDSIQRIQHQHAVDRAFTRTFPDVAYLLDSQGNPEERFGNLNNPFALQNEQSPDQPLWRELCEEMRQKFRAAFIRALSGEQLAICNIEHQGLALECRMSRLELSDGAETQERHAVLCVVRDITELRQKQKEIIYQANFDSLTDLANRHSALKFLEQAIARAQRDDLMGTVIFIDLDNFKNINDSLGHSVGDDILNQVARRIREHSGDRAFNARLGGDEFLVILEPAARTQQQALAQSSESAIHLLEVLRQPYHFEKHSFHLSASIGIAAFPSAEASAADLIRQADTAMYAAKSRGKNRFSIYDGSMQTSSQNRLQLFNDLHDAIDRDRLALHYQPQYDADGMIVGAEVLCRWTNRGAPVRPDVFIAAAEELNLISPLGYWVLSTSLRTLRRWLDQEQLPGTFKHLAINISPDQFTDKEFAGNLFQLLEDYALEPHWIELEITESVLLEDAEATRQQIQTLSEHGISIAMDDFGTGYSSLAYLSSLPLDKLKIDRSFVAEIGTEKGSGIVDYIIQLSRSQGIDLIAEGVETEAQKDYLLAQGCTQYQGFLFARPMPESDFRALLSQIYA